jgi:Putative Ig domain
MDRAQLALAFSFPALLLLFLFTAGCGSSYGGNSSTGTPTTMHVSSISPPNGQVGSVYPTQTINVSGGTPPYTATATGLPAGLSLTPNSNGAVLTISGTPTTAQTGVMFTISVKDSSPTQQTVNATYTINIAPPSLTLSPGVLPNGTVGVAYSQTVSVAGGTAPYMFTEPVPPTDNLTATNGPVSVLISGTPSLAQTGLTFSVMVTDSSTPPQTATVTYTINISAPTTLNVSSISPPNGQVGSVYPTQIINVSGGTSPYTATATGLPAGLSLTKNSNGSMLTISGTPTMAQTGVMFSISVTDSSSPPQNSNSSYTININPPSLTLSPGVLPNGTVGVAYSQTVSVAGGTAPYTFTEPVAPTDNLTAANGPVSVLISGTPSLAQTGLTFSVTVTDSSTPPQTATVTYTIDIGAASGACFLNGQYAFQFGGGGETYVGSITIASDGAVSGGMVDYKDTFGASLLELKDPITAGPAGSCANDPTVANTGTVSFTLNTGLQSTTDTQRVLHFAMRTDDTVGFAKLTIPGNSNYGTIGQIQHQNPTTNFQGSYAFGLFGSDSASANTRYGIVGALCTNARQVVTYTHADLDDAYTVATDVVLSNPLNSVTFSAPDSNGRSVMSQWNFSNGATLNLIFYVANGNKAFVMEATPPATNSQTLIGTISGVGGSGCRPSSMTFFHKGSLTNSVLDLGGVELVNSSPAFSAKIGVIQVDPVSGTASLTEDVDRAGTSSTTFNAPVTYSVSSGGRLVITYTDAQNNQEQVNGYFDGTLGGAYLLQVSNAGTTNNVTEVGTLQLQVAGPFSVTSIGGTYALMAPFENQAPLFPPTVEEVTIDNKALSFTAAGAVPSTSTNKYSVDTATGRGTVTMDNGTLGGNSLIFYIASPTKLVLTVPNNVPPVIESLVQ